MVSVLPGGGLELVGAVLGARFAGLLGLSLGWLGALVIEAALMFPTIYKVIQTTQGDPDRTAQAMSQQQDVWLIDTAPLFAISNSFRGITDATWLSKPLLIPAAEPSLPERGRNPVRRSGRATRGKIARLKPPPLQRYASPPSSSLQQGTPFLSPDENGAGFHRGVEKGHYRINVLMVTPRYFPYMGGIETHVHEVGRRLQRNGVNVTLLTTVAHQQMLSLPEEEESEGMRILRVRAWPRQCDYYLAPEIYAVIKHGRWDLIHCQGCHTLAPPLAMLAAKAAGLPYMLTFHTGGHSSPWRHKVRAVQWQILRPLLKDAVKLIGVSHFEANYFHHLLHLPMERFTIIPNGATLPEQQPEVREPVTSALIISVGRLEKYKGHHRLIAALPLIRLQRPDAHLLLLGAGPYEGELRSLARQLGVENHVSIRAIAANDRQAMAEQLAQAALVALLSDYEAHPVAIMEALALRRSVLVADTSGLRELAERGWARAIALGSTPEAIAEAVVAPMAAPCPLPPDIRLPTWDDCAHQLQAIYCAIVEGRQTCAS